jgi:UDP-N-acetyl-alpha-D-muramoyl-L-alanyl-L-glutamate epimerase
MAHALGLADWQRSGAHRFGFVGRDLDPSSGRIRLVYQLDGIELEEIISLPAAPHPLSAARAAALEPAMDLLHWVAGISYWKAACSDEVSFSGTRPDAWQSAWLNTLYRQGLAEFAYRNGLDQRQWQPFPVSDELPSVQDGPQVGLARRSLVPMGGGKDSLVAWARLTRLGENPDTVQIGGSALIARLGDSLPGQHWQIGRRLDPGLAELNAAGAWNGHVPVTAINSAILAVAALWLDYERVVFANERSADEASLLDSAGEAVNHQFSKSFEFELMFDDWVRRYVARDLKVFSLLRRDRELAICREFAALDAFHAKFSSCNRNFHLDGPRTERWCGACPKCHFVYLALAPFMQPDRLKHIFGRDLLAESAAIEGFAGLLGLDGAKPFECVGEAQEARAAALALAADSEWSKRVVVQALAARLAGLPVPSLEELCRPLGPSLIPTEWRDAA